MNTLENVNEFINDLNLRLKINIKFRINFSYEINYEEVEENDFKSTYRDEFTELYFIADEQITLQNVEFLRMFQHDSSRSIDFSNDDLGEVFYQDYNTEIIYKFTTDEKIDMLGKYDINEIKNKTQNKDELLNSSVVDNVIESLKDNIEIEFRGNVYKNVTSHNALDDDTYDLKLAWHFDKIKELTYKFI